MNTEQPVKRDERTAAVQNAGFKWGFWSLYLGLLLDCLYRAKVRHQDIGDLFVVLGIGVAVVTVYLIRHKAAVPPSWWGKFVIFYVAVAVLVSILTVLL
jgi:peptidoglycan/LPS O-acetylase OafA/YrhL